MWNLSKEKFIVLIKDRNESKKPDYKNGEASAFS